MQPKFKNQGYISNLIFNGKDIIKPWGIEFGDTGGYFSLNEKAWGSTIVSKNTLLGSKKFTSNYRVKMSDGEFDLKIDEKVKSPGEISRRAKLAALEDSLLMDFVIRYVFKMKDIRFIKINGDVLVHRNKNVYHQYKSNLVEVFLKTGQILTINANFVDESGNFDQYVYARDFKDAWIVHVRLLPVKFDREIIKLNVSWYNKAVPQKIASSRAHHNRDRHLQGC